MASLSTGVFDKSTDYSVYGSSISDREFYFILGCFIMYGLGASVASASYAVSICSRPGMIEKLVLGLGLPLVGYFISGSSITFIGFLGYNLMVIPLGFVLGPVVNTHSHGIVLKAAEATLLITGVMTLLSVLYPKFFAKLGGILFSMLIGLVVVRLLQMFIPSMGGWTFIDWISTLIFSGYIGFDIWRAQNVGKCANSALKISVQWYLDIVNLFLSLLRIFRNGD